jgi:GrpB-like predicted nucleotidyltransferase (UPF0157 family)
MKASPVALVDVQAVAPVARRVVALFEREFADVLAHAEVHHIGATALPAGHTKGDVDVNVRVEETRFPALVASLAERLQVRSHSARTGRNPLPASQPTAMSFLSASR